MITNDSNEPYDDEDLVEIEYELPSLNTDDLLKDAELSSALWLRQMELSIPNMTVDQLRSLCFEMSQRCSALLMMNRRMLAEKLNIH